MEEREREREREGGGGGGGEIHVHIYQPILHEDAQSVHTCTTNCPTLTRIRKYIQAYLPTKLFNSLLLHSHYVHIYLS